jgi:hypothetical protein
MGLERMPQVKYTKIQLSGETDNYVRIQMSKSVREIQGKNHVLLGKSNSKLSKNN